MITISQLALQAAEEVRSLSLSNETGWERSEAVDALLLQTTPRDLDELFSLHLVLGCRVERLVDTYIEQDRGGAIDREVALLVRAMKLVSTGLYDAGARSPLLCEADLLAPVGKSDKRATIE